MRYLLLLTGLACVAASFPVDARGGIALAIVGTILCLASIVIAVERGKAQDPRNDR